MAETRAMTGLPTTLISVLALLTAVAPLATDMYLPAFPRMADEFGVAPSLIQLTLTAFLIGLAVGQLVIGPLSDGLGRRRLLLVGSAVSALAGVACALAPSIELLVAARFVQGFAGAAGIVLSRAVIADRAEGTVAARAFSLMMIINGVAPIAAPLIGGVLVDTIGWRGVFWVITGLSTIMLVGVVTVVSESHPPERRTQGGVSALLGGARVVLSNRRFLGYVLAFAFGFAVMFSYIAASSFVLQNLLGLSTIEYSIAFACNAFGIVVVSALNARLVGSVGPARLLTSGIVAMGVASAALVVDAVVGPSLWPTLVLLWIAVASIGFVMANATTLALDEVQRSAGTGSAVLGALQFGLAAVVSPIVGLGGDRTAVPMAVSMLVCAVIAGGGLLLARAAGDSDGSGLGAEAAEPGY